MTPTARAELETWLATGTEGQRRHARKMLDRADDPAPARTPSPGGVPLATATRAARFGFRQCFYSSHEGCGCTGTHCYRHGRVVGLADCIECLKGK
jgi:hypothetical protein